MKIRNFIHLTVLAVFCASLLLSPSFGLTQNCPDDINNSPGNSNSSVEATIYDSNGNVLMIINCDATGNSGKIDCDLGSYNLPPDALVLIELTNGGNTETCIYDANGNLTNDPIGLPVELGNFVVTKSEDGNELFWNTYSEKSNSHFLVEYSTDGFNWNELEKLNGAGNSSEEIKYNIVHRNFNPGTTYYRLTQYDTDGKKEVLGIRAINRKGDFQVKHMNGEIHISSETEILEAKCYTLNGQELRSDNVHTSKKYVVFNTENRESEMILLQIILEDGTVNNKKIFIQ